MRRAAIYALNYLLLFEHVEKVVCLRRPAQTQKLLNDVHWADERPSTSIALEFPAERGQSGNFNIAVSSRDEWQLLSLCSLACRSNPLAVKRTRFSWR